MKSEAEPSVPTIDVYRPTITAYNIKYYITSLLYMVYRYIAAYDYCI